MVAQPNHDRLLITAASGKQIGALLPLLSEWRYLRLAVRSDASALRLTSQYPAAEIVTTDLDSPSNIRSLMKDVNVVIHVGPPFHAREAEIGIMMIDAAVGAYNGSSGSLKHFIFSTPLIKEPVYPALWNVDTKFSLTTLRDNADAISRVLHEREEHFYAQYPIISTRLPASFRQVLSVIETKLDKKITIKRLEEDEAVGLLLKRASDSGAYARDAVGRMAAYYSSKGLVGNYNTLKMVIKREPMQVAEWVDWAVKQAKEVNE
ncbi:hypothetical protein SLS59_004187 [Nothophoma quercina]|uniref:NmrA-like domain-containing protein n=1 Tax=Nothophoma quercina TaxID=749835 RepID=A0ABR3RIW8_9PLEO